jgi:hypothetical protein
MELWLPYEKHMVIHGYWPDMSPQLISSEEFKDFFQGIDDQVRRMELRSINAANVESEAMEDDTLSSTSVPHERGLPLDVVRHIWLDHIFMEVDFTLALPGLEYLSNLEATRRATLRDVAERLQIKGFTCPTVLRRNPHAQKWIEKMNTRESRIQSLYATLFINLRIWVSCLR